MTVSFKNISSLGSFFKSLFYEDKANIAERPKLEDFISTDKDGEKCDFKGTVTSLSKGEGIINNLIYFSTHNFNLFNLKIGDRAYGCAYKTSCNTWRATAIHCMNEDWDSDEEDIHQEDPTLSISNFSSVIGKVTSQVNDHLCVNGNLSFLFDKKLCSFNICVGDWIQGEKVESEEDNHMDSTSNTDYPLYRVKPLRKKIIHGMVSRVQPSHYVVNNEIYCDRKVCHLKLKLRDRVRLEIIESDQEMLSWRAISCEVDPVTSVSQSNSVNLSSLLEEQLKLKESSRKSEISDEQLTDVDFSSTVRSVNISEDINVFVKRIGAVEYITVHIQNMSEERTKYLTGVLIYPENNSQLSIDNYFKNKLPYAVKPKKQTVVILECRGSVPGYSEETCIFHFGDFMIGRIIGIDVQQSPKSVQVQQEIQNPALRGRVIKGEKPYHAAPFIPIKLPYAEVPEKLWQIVLNKLDVVEECCCLIQTLHEHNYVEKFSTLLFLEEIEMEIQMNKFDMPCANFSPQGEFLALVVNGLAEKRPSLLIGDSVMASNVSDEGINDIQFEGCIHEVLHNKVLLKFHPEFHAQYTGEDYSIQLRFNRTPLRRCHLAISLALKQLGTSVLFPTKLEFQLPQTCYIDSDNKLPLSKTDVHMPNKIDMVKSMCQKKTRNGPLKQVDINRVAAINHKTLMAKIYNRTGFRANSDGYCIPVAKIRSKNTEIPHLKWFNPELNFEQQAAVRRILEGSTRPLPYIIFGPPGTGKTVTIVEAVLQIFTMVPCSRILIVTPSNSASDLVAERVVNSGCLKKGDLIRVNSFNRSVNSIPESLLEYSDNGRDIDLVVRHRIIVSTAMNSGILYTAKLKNGHFTHVFIDEAGQLTEPETCIPLALVNSCTGQVVLAGDPKQLGPVIMSQIAKYYGLEKSLLHRLCSSVLYQPVEPALQKIYSTVDQKNSTGKELIEDREPKTDKVTFEPRLVTLLIRNYRSHHDLLTVPSKLFYHSKLISCASEEIKNKLLLWPELPNPSLPLLFHAVQGQNQQEGDSPSWFNAAETYQVCRYAISLIKFGVNPEDIGIITPYKKQVEKVRQLLQAFEVEEGIKTGPVEEFQGQERVAIILSTVRSAENLVQDDVHHSLGFLQSAERFNVAITRAMSLLVVVGNPFILKNDSNWSAFLSFCLEKGVFKHR